MPGDQYPADWQGACWDGGQWNGECFAGWRSWGGECWGVKEWLVPGGVENARGSRVGLGVGVWRNRDSPSRVWVPAMCCPGVPGRVVGAGVRGSGGVTMDRGILGA